MKVCNEKNSNNRLLLTLLKNAGWLGLSLIFFVVVWLAAYAAVGNAYLLPSPIDILKEAFLLLPTSVFWSAFASTLTRALIAFATAFLIALFFAFISYMAPLFSRFFSPFISAMRSLPAMAILLMLLVWSTPASAPVILAFLTLFPLLYTAMQTALAAVDVKLIEMSKVYRVPISKRIFQMYLPIISPYVLREGAGAISFSVKLTVSAEIMSNTYRSLGGMLQESKIYTDMPQMFALTLLVLAIGLLLEWCGIFFARIVERKTR